MTQATQTDAGSESLIGQVACGAQAVVERPHVATWIERAARAGYAAKGVVYCLVGFFAMLAAFGSGPGPRGSKSALRVLMDQPLGSVLLGAVTVGLLCYAGWCLLVTVVNPEGRGVMTRVASLGKAAVHLSLFLAALGMLIGKVLVSQEDGQAARHWTARLMTYPLGKWLAVAVGIGVAIYGLRQLYRGWRCNLDRQLSLASLQPEAARTLRNTARFGIAARGLVFAIIGAFLTGAGYHANPSETKGVPEALAYLGRHTHGEIALGTVALGLIAYGVYEFTRALYRRIDVG